MPSSSSYTFNPTRDEYIRDALRLVNVIDDDTAPNQSQYDGAVMPLDGLLKTYQSLGMNLWTVEQQETVLNDNGVITFSDFVPLKIISAYTRDYTNSEYPNDVPMFQITRNEYNQLSNKETVSARPTQFWYNYQNDHGVMQLYPLPDENNPMSIVVTYSRPIEDAGFNGNFKLDVPSYWADAITYGLAYKLAPRYGVPPADRNLLKGDWQFFLDAALNAGQEEGSLFLQPNYDYRR